MKAEPERPPQYYMETANILGHKIVYPTYRCTVCSRTVWDIHNQQLRCSP